MNWAGSTLFITHLGTRHITSDKEGLEAYQREEMRLKEKSKPTWSSATRPRIIEAQYNTQGTMFTNHLEPQYE